MVQEKQRSGNRNGTEGNCSFSSANNLWGLTWKVLTPPRHGNGGERERRRKGNKFGKQKFGSAPPRHTKTASVAVVITAPSGQTRKETKKAI